MPSRKAPHGLRFQRLTCIALLGLFAGTVSTERVCEAGERSDPYDVLYDAIMTRYGPDGEAYGAHESAPAIFSGSAFPFDDRTFNRLSSAVEAFAALSQTKIEAYSDIQRALMQRHLWHVFDATAPYVAEITDRETGKSWLDFRKKSHMQRREAMRPKIASLIQRLALPKARILALPDTAAATLASGVFPPRYDPSSPFKPFLPPDLFAKDTSWVCLGDKYESPAPFHQVKLKFRSAFLSFMRLPGGRDATLEYIKNDTQERGNVKHFPAGTQFAFFEQAFLISDEGELVLSPLVLSISLRAYLDVERKFSRVSRVPTQSLAEFVAQPHQLIQGNAVMKPLGQRDIRFDAGDVSGLGEAIDPFERRNEQPLTRGRGPLLRRPRLDLCMTCHNDRGADGVAGGGGVFGAQASSPEEIVKETMSQKRDHYTWKLLIELWGKAPGPNDGQVTAESAGRPDQAKRSSGGTDTTSKQALPERPRSGQRSGLQIVQTSSKADTKTADPYDVLYDVLMTRYGPDGKAYGTNESSPSIFKESNFPFDDRTFNKLDAALDAFGALPQETIESYSDIQRALMQRHLWQVFDATLPFRWIGVQEAWSRNHPARRDALRPKIASLIQRLALTRAQILALPDTRANTVESGGFPRQHDSDDALKPFLSSDLYATESSWVGIGFADPPAPFHQNKVKFRSAFLTFMRLPGGRTETLEYLARLKPKYEQFPVGTQFALIERAFLISEEGEMVLSPLTVSISLRAYLDVERTAPKLGRDPTQSVAEFVMQPRRLMQGHAVMKALGPRDMRYEAGDVDIHNDAVEPFEDVVHVPLREDKNDMLRRPRLTLCMNCHRSRGRRSVRGGFFSDLKARTPDEVVKVTLQYKRAHETWKALGELWQDDAAGEETQSSVRTNHPKQLLGNASANREANTTADPYDELYDVIMVRKDSEGIAYVHNEVTPLIYGRSEFPFDRETFPKLMAALDRFNSLPHEKIDGYGEVKRALLQGHLWAVFDATMPPPDFVEQTHVANRRAAQKTLATLIARVALTSEEILALPDTRAATIESGGFPQQHDPTDPFKPFLPTDLYAKESSWVCLGKVDRYRTHHARVARWRSVFFPFVRLPAGRKATLEYIAKLNAREVFPVGTQFALIEQAFLISDAGELVLSPIVSSIQLRAYLNVTLTDLEAHPQATQCVAEFVMQPRQLMQGKSEMRAVGPEDGRFIPFDDTGGRVDIFETHGGTAIRHVGPRLRQCSNCHGRSRSGVRSLGDFRFGDVIVSRHPFEAGSPVRISQGAAAVKREDETWKKLQELWPEESGPKAPPR